MTPEAPPPFVAFAGSRLVAEGRLEDVALKAKALVDREEHLSVLVFDGQTSELVEIDLRGTAADVTRRLPGGTAGEEPSPAVPGEASAPRAPGRPRLGVVAREVTLLPRHWEWLGTQPGGASVTLRRLVEAARRSSAGEDRERKSREAAFRFANAMAGNEPGFEEAIRALFAGDRELFATHSEPWPPDVRAHARRLAARSFQEEAPPR